MRGFEKHSKTHYRMKKNKHLKNCIEAAKELAEGKLDYSQLDTINNRLSQSKCKPYVRINNEIEPMIAELKRLINFHDRIDLQQVGLEEYKDYEKVLSEISNHSSIEPKAANLCQVLISLAKIQVNKNHLKKVHIEKLLTVISTDCSRSPFEKVKELGNQVLNLKGTWTNNKKSSGVVDFRLKVLVCKKIAFILQANGFLPGQAREIALNVEEKMRRRDPTMDVKYRKCCKMMIRDLRNVRYEDFAVLEH